MLWVFVILLIGILIGLLLGFWLRRGHHHLPPPPPPPPTGPPTTIPDNLDPVALGQALGTRLAGTPANGAVLPGAIGNQVVWVDGGDEVLVHLDSIQTNILDRMVLISIDLESDQTGRTPLIASFALGDASDPAGLIAVTDEFPRGDGALAARWGEAVQAALWSTLLLLAQEHALERGKSPTGISAAAGTLTLHAGQPIGAHA